MTTRLDETMAAAVAALESWYDARRPKKGGEPSRTTVGAGLAVLEHFAEKFPLSPEDYLTPNSQVKGAGGAGIKKILARFGETRIYTDEGGRTSRGARSVAEELVEKLTALPHVVEISAQERVTIARELQRRLAAHAAAFLNKQHLKPAITLTKPTAEIIGDILAAARQKSLSGAVAQHLVGAKLALRFPDQDIPNHSATTADEQTGRVGDFFIGDTAIHVTVAPMEKLFVKCTENLNSGRRALLVVPAGKAVDAARQLADNAGLTGRVGVATIEDFIGQNVDEMAGFEVSRLRHYILKLLRTYNARVTVERDPGLLIEIPKL